MTGTGSGNTALTYRAEGEYPKLMVNGKNPAYVRMLLFDYAGRASELTAITQYIYGSLITKNAFPDVSAALKSIAIVEMGHLGMLGQLIILLGGNPEFATLNTRGNQMFWDSGYVDYSTTLKRILSEGVDDEKKAYSEYCRHIELIKDEGVTAVLKQIAADEEVHMRALSALYGKYF